MPEKRKVIMPENVETFYVNFVEIRVSPYDFILHLGMADENTSDKAIVLQKAVNVA